jgi:hypothetical protein
LRAAGVPGGLALRASRLVRVFAYGLGAGVVPLAWEVLRQGPALPFRLLRDWRAQCLALWIAPGLAYFLLVHVEQPGHTFTILPALILLAGLATATLGAWLARFHRLAGALPAGLVLLANGLFFLVGPPAVNFGHRPTWATIRQYDRYVSGRLSAVRERFPPETTALLVSGRFARLPAFYLRDYRHTVAAHHLTSGLRVLPPQVHALVVFDDLVVLNAVGLDGPVSARADSQGLRSFRWGVQKQATLAGKSLSPESARITLWIRGGYSAGDVPSCPAESGGDFRQPTRDERADLRPADAADQTAKTLLAGQGWLRLTGP